MMMIIIIIIISRHGSLQEVKYLSHMSANLTPDGKLFQALGMCTKHVHLDRDYFWK